MEKKYKQIASKVCKSVQKHYISILLFLLILLVWKLYETHFMRFFNGHILPLMDGLAFSTLTNIIFGVICLFLVCILVSIARKRYYLPFEIVPYSILFIYEYIKYRISGNYIAPPNLFLGLGYIDVFVTLLGCTIGVVSFVRFKPISLKQKQITDEHFLLDRPIESLDEDILDYKTTAEDIIQRISTINNSCSIGLIAHWGMGKTSFLNMLGQTLPKENYIILKFNPRYSHKPTDIQKDFFNLLYSELSKYDIRFTSSFRNYLKSINVLVDKSFMSKIINLHEVWDKEFEKEDVNNAIKRINKRIVVIIDDFDRLVREEIIEIFKLIDGNASFTNIIFISAYDKDYINKIVDNQTVKQQAFFSDKFFTIEIPLPLRPYKIIYDYLLKQLVRLTKASEERRNEYNRALTNNIDILKLYLPTLRDVKRFLNLFIRPYLDVQEEVVFRDYFLLNLIKLKYIDEFNKLYCKEYIDDGDLKHMNQYTLNVNDKTECECIDILKVLFPEDSCSYRSINNKSAFSIYFYETVYDDMRIKDMKQVFTMPSMADVHKYISSIDKTRIESFTTYLGSVNYLSFADFKQFDRYIDIIMYLISKGYDNISLSTPALDLVYKRTSSEIQKKYEVTDVDYNSFLYTKFKGEYPNFPLSIMRHIIHGILKKEFPEEIILSHDKILNIACASLEELMEKEPTIDKLHLELLYNCIDNIEHGTRKYVLNKSMCNKVCEAIKKKPENYFFNFVRLVRNSLHPDYGFVACEPFWKQIFGSKNNFETYLSTLNEEKVPNIELIKNFWELYKYNDYTPIEFSWQGNVQEKIDNMLIEEANKLRQLLDIKTRFEKDEEERISKPQKISYYKQMYQAYLSQIDGIGLYIKLNGELRTQIQNAKEQLK